MAFAFASEAFQSATATERDVSEKAGDEKSAHHKIKASLFINLFLRYYYIIEEMMKEEF